MVDRKTSQRWAGDIKKVRRILLHALRGSEKLREPLAEALELLESLDDQVRELADQAEPAARRTVNPHARYQPKRYTVEKRRRGVYLCEYRVGGRAQPFCCPREDYDATAETVASLDDWTQYDVMKNLVSKRTGQTQPDYLIRLCLRFWQAVDPAIIEKDRTFYRASTRGSFRKAATRAWRDLETKGGE